MMKIVAGLGSLEDYETLAEAGADELFTGFVPLEWNLKYGNMLPMNRREVLFYHTHIGTIDDMKILSEKVKEYKVPVTITMNALYYTKGQIEEIAQIIIELSSLGFKNYIIADVNLIRELVKRKIECKIHMSGEIGQWNIPEVDLFSEWFPGDSVKRIIFHRKNDIEHMERCITHSKRTGFVQEYEAFLMNEKCHYTGGFCNSLHCDEMVHLCQLEYRLVPEEESEKNAGETFCQPDENMGRIPGETGCGLCALSKMQEAGITHLKIVGRGEAAECMAKDIRAVREAIDILNISKNEEEYISTMRGKLFDNRCSGVCYYENI